MPFESIHNYYEQLVLRAIQDLPESANLSESDDFVSDIACVALNQLPTRYVRHNVDMVFYMTAEERLKIEQDVKKAVAFALDYVSKHASEERPQTYSQ